MLIHISSYSMYVVFIIFLITALYRRRNRVRFSAEYILFGTYITVATITEIVATVFVLQGKNSLFIGHIYYPVEFALLSILMIRFNEKYEIFLYVYVLFYLLWVVILIIQIVVPFNEFSTIADLIHSASLFFLAIWTLLNNSVNSREQRFIILIAILIYFCFSTTLNPIKFIIPEYFYIQSIINLITNVLLAGSFACRRQL